jgi:hypothetical protein
MIGFPLYQAKLKWRIELLLDPGSIQPRAGYAFANEAAQASDPRICDDFGEPLRVSGYDVFPPKNLSQLNYFSASAGNRIRLMSVDSRVSIGRV